VFDRNVNGGILGFKGSCGKMGTKWMMGNLKCSFLHLMSLVFEPYRMKLDGRNWIIIRD